MLDTTDEILIQSMFQILLAAIGSIGFALAFNADRRRVLVIGLGGGLSWAIYLICKYFSLSIFTASVISSGFVYLYSVIFSKVQKTPITVFFAPILIPLIPGGNLYYATYALIDDNTESFFQNSKEMIHIALGLVVGFLICSILWKYIDTIILKNSHKL